MLVSGCGVCVCARTRWSPGLGHDEKKQTSQQAPTSLVSHRVTSRELCTKKRQKKAKKAKTKKKERKREKRKRREKGEKIEKGKKIEEKGKKGKKRQSIVCLESLADEVTRGYQQAFSERFSSSKCT